MTGDERAAIYQLAAYQSRVAKRRDGAETTAQLRARWWSEAVAAGFLVDRWLGHVLGRRSATPKELRSTGMGLKPSLELALVEAIDRLERSHSTWGRAQVVQILSAVIPAHRSGNAEQVRLVVEAATDLLLAHPDVVGLSSPDRADARHGSPRYSTWWTLQTEQAVLDTQRSPQRPQRRVAPLRGRTRATSASASSSKNTCSTTVRSTPSNLCHNLANRTPLPPLVLPTSNSRKT